MSGLEPRGYALRFQERALRDIDAAFVRLAELTSDEIADEWRDGLREAIAGLAASPRRHPLAPERFRREVRHLLYQRPGSRVTYRVLFTVTGEEEGASEGPTVTILHLRHGAAKPLTRAEARQVEGQG